MLIGKFEHGTDVKLSILGGKNPLSRKTEIDGVAETAPRLENTATAEKNSSGSGRMSFMFCENQYQAANIFFK